MLRWLSGHRTACIGVLRPVRSTLFLVWLGTVSVYAAEVKPQEFSSEDIQEEIQQEVTREREKEAAEDPLAQRQSEKTDNPALHEIMPNRFSFYGSLRFRYRQTSSDSLVGDGGSRVGLDGAWQFVPEYWLIGRGEVGFKLFSQLDRLLDPGAEGGGEFLDDVFLRLGYVGVEFPVAFLTYGKNWSTYYQIASFTDRFQGTGAGASGTFNAGTDGGPSGTGRADTVWQTRIHVENPWEKQLHLKPFNINLQGQAEGQKIPYATDVEYQYSFGLSAILERYDNFKTGFAFNYAAVDDADLPYLNTLGIDGADMALLFGMQWFGDRWYAATVFSWLDNHMATNDGMYFDAWGTEGYGHYQLFDRIWLVGGWNYLEPRDGESQAGAYVLRYGVLGLRYTFKGFKQMIYANIRFDTSRPDSTSSEEVGNVYTVGVKWDFDW